MICREMTKYYEEYLRDSVNNISNINISNKGEITIVISENNNEKKLNELEESDKEKIKKLIKKMSIKNIISVINKEKKMSKKIIYNYCVNLKNEN